MSNGSTGPVGQPSASPTAAPVAVPGTSVVADATRAIAPRQAAVPWYQPAAPGAAVAAPGAPTAWTQPAAGYPAYGLPPTPSPAAAPASAAGAPAASGAPSAPSAVLSNYPSSPTASIAATAPIAPTAPAMPVAPVAAATPQGYQVPTQSPLQAAQSPLQVAQRASVGCPCGNAACDGSCGAGAPANLNAAHAAPGAIDYTAWTGGVGGPGCAPYGGCGQYSTWGCGLMGREGGACALGSGCGACGCDPCRAPGGYWFGGIYGLLMERDQSNYLPLGFSAIGLGVGAYPRTSDFVLFGDDADIGFQGGIEARLGRVFAGAVDPCTGCYAGPRWGLEGVYWELFESDDDAFYYDQPVYRTHGMVDFRGLTYDAGAGARPVNHFYDYAPAVSDYTNGGALDQLEVRTLSVCRSFEARNFELNLLRLSICGGGPSVAVGPAACAAPGDPNCTGCALNPSGIVPRGQNCGGSRFSCTGVCGFRYLEFDETFCLGVYYENMTTPAFDYLTYYMGVENRLAGFQIGCNNLYRIGCKWGLHLNTTVGIYGNDIDVEQYFITPGDDVRYVGTGGVFYGNASKTDVSMIGELRLGASYQHSCHCRLYGGWRVVGVTGVALAQDQIPGAFVDPNQLAWVTNDGSLLLHGLQTGVEWNY